jgi:hypothetical protein
MIEVRPGGSIDGGCLDIQRLSEIRLYGGREETIFEIHNNQLRT